MDRPGPPEDDPGFRTAGQPGVLREWDGHVWTAEWEPSTTTAPRYRRRPMAFLRHRWFITWVIAMMGALACAVGFLATGWAIALAVAGVASTVGFALALILGVALRLGMTPHPGGPERSTIGPFIWLVGAASGALAFPLSMAIEQVVKAQVTNGDRIQLWLAGPIEESSKLLLPVVLWFALASRMRDPRIGCAVALISGATYGVIEGCLASATMALTAAREGGGMGELVFKTAVVLLQRPTAELLHALLTAGIAAFAWRAAWGRRSIITGPFLAAALVAMAIHSVNDGVIAAMLPGPWQLLLLPLVLVGTYLLFTKAGARALVPPSRIPENPPGWRPRFLRIQSAA